MALNLKVHAMNVLCSSICQVALLGLHPILAYPCGCRSLCSHGVVFHSRPMRACRPDICSLFPGSVGTSYHPLLSTRALFLLFTRSVSATLPSCASILASPVKVLSTIARIRSRRSSWCGFVALPCDASAAQRQPSGVTVSLHVSRQYVESFRLSF